MEANGPIRLPHNFAGAAIERHDLFLVLKEHSTLAHRQRESQDVPGYLVFLLPDKLARVRFQALNLFGQIASDVPAVGITPQG